MDQIQELNSQFKKPVVALYTILQERKLTSREIEIVEKVVMGLSNKEIADQLFVCDGTIKQHMTAIYTKIGLKSRAQLIVWAIPYLVANNN